MIDHRGRVHQNGCAGCYEERNHILSRHHLPKKTGALSRYERGSICDICARAEALADGLGPDESGMTFSMARIAMQNEYEENIRLPAGTGMGIFRLGARKWIDSDEVQGELVEANY